MDWILSGLTDQNALCVHGWNKAKGKSDPTRRVTVVVQDFVIVLGLYRSKTQELRANFVTCYKADSKTIVRVRAGPRWKLEDFANAAN